jgi:hypothetical protein
MRENWVFGGVLIKKCAVCGHFGAKMSGFGAVLGVAVFLGAVFWGGDIYAQIGSFRWILHSNLSVFFRVSDACTQCGHFGTRMSEIGAV